jgi:hypothetical protein
VPIPWAGPGDTAMQQLPVRVGDGKAPLPAGHQGGEVAGQPSVDRAPAGQLSWVLVVSEQGGQPCPQLHPRTHPARLPRGITRRCALTRSGRGTVAGFAVLGCTVDIWRAAVDIWRAIIAGFPCS